MKSFHLKYSTTFVLLFFLCIDLVLNAKLNNNDMLFLTQDDKQINQLLKQNFKLNKTLTKKLEDIKSLNTTVITLSDV